jgi:hypothetical protein
MAKFTPASAPDARGCLHGREAFAIAQEHPHVGEQVMPQVDRLGTLQMRVSRHRPVDVLLGARQQHRRQRAESLLSGGRGVAHVQHDVGRDLVVA